MDVVAVRDAEELVEPLARWQELGLVAQVPLAVDGGFVTDAFEDLGDGDFFGVEPLGICLLYTSPSPRDRTRSRMPSSA